MPNSNVDLYNKGKMLDWGVQSSLLAWMHIIELG